MNVESAILRAYVFASQCNYIEAERTLKSVPETLKTPHGVDLFARILWAAGNKDDARRLWEDLVRQCPNFEPAVKALSSDEGAFRFESADIGLISKRRLYAILGSLAVVIGVTFSLGKFCGSPSEDVPCRTVIAETVLKGRIGGSDLRVLSEGFLTNLTETTVLVIKGGSGRTITDRQRKLAVIADCIKEVAKIPVTKMYFQPADVSTDDVILQIVPAYSASKEVSE